MEKTYTALVTGSLGEVGSLMWDSFECTPYDIKEGLDIFDTERLVGNMRGKDVVIHLAAYAHPFMEGVTKEDYWHLNFEGTKQVVECMRKAGVKKILFPSSGAVYGVSRPEGARVVRLPITEENTAPPETLHHYGQTKLACEEWLLEQEDIQALIFRLEAPGLLDQGLGVFEGHLFAHVSRDNLKEFMGRLMEYDGPSDIFNIGDPTTNKFCPNTIAFAKEKYPDIPCDLESPTEPLYSVKKAQKVLGYVGRSVLPDGDN